ncbi:MAG: glycosyltransferase [Planctomycetota bacterium]
MTEQAEQSERTLLIVSYWYPPAVGAAAERIRSFAEYLPLHGWNCHVLTARRTNGAPALSGVTVHETPDRAGTRGPVFADYDPRRRPSRTRALLRDFLFPDRFVYWQRKAVPYAKELVTRLSPELILASFPPASAVLLALNVSRETNVPLVIDFRDPWFGPGGYEPRRTAARKAHRRLRDEAIGAATALITVSEAMADAIARENAYDRKRIFVIPNGYEDPGPNDYAADSSERDDQALASGPVTIAHVGTVIQRNRPDLFFQSLTILLGEKQLANVTFRFVGNLSRTFLDDAGLSPQVQTTGLVSPQAARREMHNADALLLLTGGYVGKWGYSAKLFQYIRTGRPILCLEEQPNSNDRRFLERFAQGRAFFAPLDDPRRIAEAVNAIGAYIAEYPDPVLVPAPGFEAYSRRDLAAKLAGLLA